MSDKLYIKATKFPLWSDNNKDLHGVGEAFWCDPIRANRLIANEKAEIAATMVPIELVEEELEEPDYGVPVEEDQPANCVKKRRRKKDDKKD